jgi:hypothetical protein
VGWIGEQKRESRPTGEKKRGEKGLAQEKENGSPSHRIVVSRNEMRTKGNFRSEPQGEKRRDSHRIWRDTCYGFVHSKP